MAFSTLRRLAGVALAAATLFAAPAAFAQTYTIHRTFTGQSGETGTAVLELANSTLTDGNYTNSNSVPPQLIAATLTFNNLGSTPASTTFTRSDLTGFTLQRSGGAITEINFWANANVDGYTLAPTATFVTIVNKGGGGGYNGVVTNAHAAPPAPAAVPTMTEWAMIGFALALAAGAALMIQRRRSQLA